MPGFPDKFMPFMDEPPGGKISSTVSIATGTVIKAMRNFTTATVDKEPKWRHKGKQLTTGYHRHS
jgi:hydrogenase small subunit